VGLEPLWVVITLSRVTKIVKPYLKTYNYFYMIELRLLTIAKPHAIFRVIIIHVGINLKELVCNYSIRTLI
jgi:hypothetical protein